MNTDTDIHTLATEAQQVVGAAITHGRVAEVTALLRAIHQLEWHLPLPSASMLETLRFALAELDAGEQRALERVLLCIHDDDGPMAFAGPLACMVQGWDDHLSELLAAYAFPTDDEWDEGEWESTFPRRERAIRALAEKWGVTLPSAEASS